MTQEHRFWFCDWGMKYPNFLYFIRESFISNITIVGVIQNDNKDTVNV